MSTDDEWIKKSSYKQNAILFHLQKEGNSLRYSNMDDV
jgi:hypothetical protein